MSHLISRLQIAREHQDIAAAVPRSSYRTPQQAAIEQRMMQAALLAKAVSVGSKGSAAAENNGASNGSGGAPMFHRTGAASNGSGGAAAGAGAGSSSATRRPLLRPAGMMAAAPPAPPAAPAMPFVYRRAARDVQITDPDSGDILQLDAGTWVLTAADLNASKTSITIYTTDPDDGKVLSYEVPIQGGRLGEVFDMHTLNPIETVAGVMTE